MKTKDCLFRGNTVQCNVRLGPIINEEIKIIGRYLGMTKSQVVRQAINEFVIDFDKKVVKRKNLEQR